ncbi:hypothetical protein GOV10_03455 [Candidatus Woesearchaeota archaeon]|nr:hypothetical protein [Candidatus Woesearchaeota archaeon]
MKSCGNCKHWRQTTFYDGVENDGVCREIKTHLEIEVIVGWDGGVIGVIETTDKFYCAAFEEKK